MPQRQEPLVRTLRAQWLGQQMRDLRERRGLALDQAAEFLERDPSALSRYERAEWPFRRPVVDDLLNLYGVHTPPERERLLRLAEDIWHTDRWADDTGEAPDTSFIDFPWLESRAEQICCYDPMLLPAPFQTQEYAEAVLHHAAGGGGGSDAQMATWLRLRLERAQRMRKGGRRQVTAIIDEAALRRVVHSPAVMHTQLTHIAGLADRVQVQVRVLPTRVGLHAGLDGAFWLFRMPAPYPSVAYARILGGRLFMESPKADRYAAAFDRLQAAALSPTESAALITAIAAELA